MIAIMPTASGITMTLPGKARPLALSKDHKHYDEVLEILRSGSGAEQAAQIIELIEGPARRVAQALADSTLSTNLAIKDGVLTYQGVGLHHYAAQKLVELVTTGFPVGPLVNFLEKLMTHQTPKVVNRLYAFLEKGGIPITEDGDFVAYKVVKGDFTDKRTGTMDNSPGKEVSMPRWEVDDNDNQTCSSGLHVCSYDYIQAFGSSGDRLVACKVNPADVVSIPVDYQDTKMRVCRYKVVEEIPEFYEAHKVPDVLADSPVYSTGDENQGFEVRITDEYGRDDIYPYDTLTEAVQSYESDEELEDVEHEVSITLVNRMTDVTVASRVVKPSATDDSDSSDDDSDEDSDEEDYDFFVCSEVGDRKGVHTMMEALDLLVDWKSSDSDIAYYIENSSGIVVKRC